MSPSEIETVLKNAGINPTAQRIAICRFVLCEADHPSAETIKQWIDRNFPKMSLATVYNTLRVLVDGGLLKELKVPHTESVLYDNNVAEHYHFFDEQTGELVDIAPEHVTLAPHLGEGFTITGVDVLLRGTRT
ncbi:MAG TPA: Fur family transcriptional regulator [Stenomitos sp.]